MIDFASVRALYVGASKPILVSCYVLCGLTLASVTCCEAVRRTVSRVPTHRLFPLGRTFAVLLGLTILIYTFAVERQIGRASCRERVYVLV